MRAGIYARLSVLKQGEGATEAAMERQEDDCRRLCQSRGWQIAKVYPDEGISAYQGRRRPAFEEALADLESGAIDVLVCWKLDRLVRRLRDWVRVREVVERNGRKLVSVMDGDATPLLMDILASVAENESRNTSVRLQRQRKQAAVNGEANQGGRRLFSYTTQPRTIVEDEAEVVREAARRLLSGHSQRSVTAWMNSVSATTTGREWSQRTAREMLLSPALAGLRTYKGEIVAEGQWPPVLPREQWGQLAALLRSRPRRGAPVKHLLSGIVVCGRCGAPLITHRAPKKRGGRRDYVCPKNVGLGRPGCGRLSVKAEEVERVVAQMVLHRLSGPGLARALAQRDVEQGAGVAAELAAVDAQIADIENAYKQLKVKLDAFLRVHEPLVAKAEELRGQLRQGTDGAVLSQLPSAEQELRDWWQAAELDQRRAVLMAVVERVAVGPAQRKSRTFDEARLRPPFGPIWKA